MICRLIICLVIVISASACSEKMTLKPFTSDGCSMFPDGTLSENDLWLECCIEHDKAYWKGGTYEERVVADEKLRACVDALGEPYIAELMHKGVRVGGTPYLPTDFKWGYGWTGQRGYEPLTEEELRMVNEMLEE